MLKSLSKKYALIDRVTTAVWSLPRPSSLVLPVAIAHIVMAYEKFTSSEVDSYGGCAARGREKTAARCCITLDEKLKRAIFAQRWMED